MYVIECAIPENPISIFPTEGMRILGGGGGVGVWNAKKCKEMYEA